VHKARPRPRGDKGIPWQYATRVGSDRRRSECARATALSRAAARRRRCWRSRRRWCARRCSCATRTTGAAAAARARWSPPGRPARPAGATSPRSRTRRRAASSRCARAPGCHAALVPPIWLLPNTAVIHACQGLCSRLSPCRDVSPDRSGAARVACAHAARAPLRQIMPASRVPASSCCRVAIRSGDGPLCIHLMAGGALGLTSRPGMLLARGAAREWRARKFLSLLCNGGRRCGPGRQGGAAARAQGNQFGLLFHQAAERIGGGYSMDSFDATGIRARAPPRPPGTNPNQTLFFIQLQLHACARLLLRACRGPAAGAARGSRRRAQAAEQAACQRPPVPSEGLRPERRCSATTWRASCASCARSSTPRRAGREPGPRRGGRRPAGLRGSGASALLRSAGPAGCRRADT